MYCGRVQQAVVGRVVLLTLHSRKKQSVGAIIKFYETLSMRKSWINIIHGVMNAEWYKIHSGRLFG